jgi:hypothetical protein
MSRSTMHNPYYAQRVWSRLRSARPLDRVHPADRKHHQAIAAGDRTREELAAHFAGTCDDDLPTQTQEKGPPLMIKLNCGISRKVGEPNYGSRGASVNVELELESSAAQDAGTLHEKIRRLFAVAKASVDEELGLSGIPAGAAPPPAQRAPTNGQAPGSAAPKANGANGDRPASEGQLRAIQAICGRLNLDQDQEADRMFHRPASKLSLSDASKLIDHLKQAQECQSGH